MRKQATWKSVVGLLNGLPNSDSDGSVSSIHFGRTYAGLVFAATVGAPTINGVVAKGRTSTISVSVDAPGFVRFLLDGKRIPGCLKVATT